MPNPSNNPERLMEGFKETYGLASKEIAHRLQEILEELRIQAARPVRLPLETEAKKAGEFFERYSRLLEPKVLLKAKPPDTAQQTSA